MSKGGLLQQDQVCSDPPPLKINVVRLLESPRLVEATHLSWSVIPPTSSEGTAEPVSAVGRKDVPMGISI